MTKFKFKDWVFEITEPSKKIFFTIDYAGDGYHIINYYLEDTDVRMRREFRPYQFKDFVKEMSLFDGSCYFEGTLKDFVEKLAIADEDRLISIIPILLDGKLLKLIDIQPAGDYLGYLEFGYYNKSFKIRCKVFEKDGYVFCYPYSKSGKPIFYWNHYTSKENFTERLITGELYEGLKLECYSIERLKLNTLEVNLQWLTCKIGLTLEADLFLKKQASKESNNAT